MGTKLTLSIDQRVVEAAKIYAKTHKTSVSKLVENYFLDLLYSKPKKYSKELEELIGVAEVENPDLDYKAAKLEYLTKKYLKD